MNFFKKPIKKTEHEEKNKHKSFKSNTRKQDENKDENKEKIRREKWTKIAFWLSIFAASMSLVFSLASFLVSDQTDSSSILSNAFDALLGTVSSIAVAWRFGDLLNGGTLGRKRERIATVGIGVGFLATGIATVAASIIHLLDKTRPIKTNELLIILTCSLTGFLTLSQAQTCLAKKLDSQSLRAASADNALAAAMSFGILISTFIYRSVPKLWWLDHGVALILGVISGGYGLHLFLLTVICNKEFFEEKGKEAEPLKK